MPSSLFKAAMYALDLAGKMARTNPSVMPSVFNTEQGQHSRKEA